MEIGKLKKYRKAGKIAGAARNYGKGLIKEGASLLEVANKIEAFIIEKGASVAFPTNLTVDHEAAHYTPFSGDPKVFERGQLVKLDVGAHIDGYIGDTAVTVEVGTRENEQMILASEEALSTAIGMIRPDVDLGRVGAAVEKTINSFGFKPIKNRTGHSLERFRLHAGISVPSVGEPNNGRVKKGDVIAIEPFATDGAGKVEGEKMSNIYRQIKDVSVKNPKAEDLLKRIKKERRGLPFSQRWAACYVDRPKPILQKLVAARAISPYPILVDVDKGMVTQAEHTVLITEDGCEVLT